jgi:hypothetical protein
MNIQETTPHEIPAFPTLVGSNPSILDLCLHYRFDADSLAFIAEVDIQTVPEMFSYHPVCKIDAQKVLMVLSELLCSQYTFENVDVPIFEEEEGKDGNEQSHFC